MKFIKNGNNITNTEILNDLIQINNDRVNGYEKPIKELASSDTDLKSLSQEIKQSCHNKSTLTQEVQVVGATPDNGAIISRKYIARGWM